MMSGMNELKKINIEVLGIIRSIMMYGIRFIMKILNRYTFIYISYVSSRYDILTL
jgi:hypothetical protein